MNINPKNLNQALIRALKANSGKVCYKVKRDGKYRDITFDELKKLALRLSLYLSNGGFAPGSRVLILSENSHEWMAACMASLLSGGIVIPLGTNIKPEQLGHIVKDSAASLVFVQNADQAADIGTMCGNRPAVVVMEKFEVGDSSWIPLASVTREVITDESFEELKSRAESLEPESPAFIFYTAKETGTPRGVLYSHGRILRTLDLVSEWLTLDEFDLGFTTLNWSNFPSFVAALRYIMSGAGNALAGGVDTVFEDLQQTSPTVTMTSPFALENIYRRIMDELDQMPESRRKIFQWALSLGRQYRSAESTASKELRDRYARADMVFFGRMRAILGGRLNRIYCSGANLSRELAGFAESIGLQPLNAYSVVEAGGFPAVSTPYARRSGSCGQVSPGYQIRISDEGEVLVRGETVTGSYWNPPEDLESLFDQDGWLRTGDLGRFDQDGYLFLTGHKQSIFLLTQGHKIVPSKIENRLVDSPYIKQALVFGEGKSYVSSLIVPNFQAIGDALHGNDPSQSNGGPPIDSFSPAVKEIIDRAVSDVNDQLNVWERVEAYTLIDKPFSGYGSDSEETERNNRAEIFKKYSLYINAMYPDMQRVEKDEITLVQLDPDQLRDLLEKQDILTAWMDEAGIGFLLDLARTKGIDALSMVNICETATSIAQMQSEEKPVSTAFIVGDPTQISRVLPDSEIQFHRYDHIRRMQQVVIALARIVDGVVLGYGIDKYGYLRRVHKLDIDTDGSENFLLGPQFRKHAAISDKCDAIVFYVPVGGRQVRVFSGGQMVARYSNGNWMAENFPHIEEAVERLALKKKYDAQLLRRIFRCAFLMSERNLGAIFVLGESDRILKKSDPPEISPFATISNTEIEKLTDGEIINFAKQDGATIIDSAEGKLRGCMVLLRPSAETRADIGIGKGARHSSASKMSAEAKCLAITVSQDGPITVYDSGERVLTI
jgi:long-chain acyl-CoA synthetase